MEEFASCWRSRFVFLFLSFTISSSLFVMKERKDKPINQTHLLHKESSSLPCGASNQLSFFTAFQSGARPAKSNQTIQCWRTKTSPALNESLVWLAAGRQGNSPAQESKKVCFLGCCSIGCWLPSLVGFAFAVRGPEGSSAKERQTRRATNPTIQLYFSLCLPQPAFQPAEKKRSLIG